jgi:hypothetical protein
LWARLLERDWLYGDPDVDADADADVSADSYPCQLGRESVLLWRSHVGQIFCDLLLFRGAEFDALGAQYRTRVFNNNNLFLFRRSWRPLSLAADGTLVAIVSTPPVS